MSVVFYLIISGIVSGLWIYHQRKFDEDYFTAYSESTIDFVGTFAIGLIWPIGVPVGIGILYYKYKNM